MNFWLSQSGSFSFLSNTIPTTLEYFSNPDFLGLCSHYLKFIVWGNRAALSPWKLFVGLYHGSSWQQGSEILIEGSRNSIYLWRRGGRKKVCLRVVSMWCVFIFSAVKWRFSCVFGMFFFSRSAISFMLYVITTIKSVNNDYFLPFQ